MFPDKILTVSTASSPATRKVVLVVSGVPRVCCLTATLTSFTSTRASC